MLSARLVSPVLRPSLACVARSFSSTAAALSDAKRVCIVGTGPAGFYTAKYLLRDHPDVKVDLLDALPTPFGLVRSGVAPDHPEVKSVQNDFEEVAQNPRLSFLGNVGLGWDISVQDLQKHYNAVVLAYGAASDRKLGVPGEDLGNVFSARAFVNWYNGHPDYVDFKPNLDCESVVIIGQGNVAIDCARILVKSVPELETTDIAAHALEALKKSSIKRVFVAGRRGHVQAAFTMKELREVTRLEDASCVVDYKELAQGMTPASAEEIKSHRAKKRMNELLTKVAETPLDETKSKSLYLRFLLSPTEFLPSPENPDLVGSVSFDVTRLEGDADAQQAVPSGRTESLPAGMVLESIGYKSLATPGVPFDDKKHVVRNTKGRVVEEDGSQVAGLYCVGWLKRGPSGIIGTNITCARETVGVLLEDAANSSLPDVEVDGGLDAVADVVVANGKDRSALVDWDGYLGIDAEEKQRGASAGKPREKLVSLDDMLEAATKRSR